MVAPISIEQKDLANNHLDRSISFAMCGKIDQAIEAALKAVEIDSEFGQAYNKLGDYYLKKGMVKEAAEVYRKAININPDSHNSHFDLGRTLALLGQLDEALISLNKALDLKPTHGETYAHMGLIYIKKEDYNQATDYLQKALENDPDHLMTNFLMGMALQKTGNTGQANNFFNSVITRYTTLTNMKSRFAEGYYYIGKCHHYMGNLDKAVANLEKAVEFDTEDVDYHYSFGMLYSDADAFFALAEVLLEAGKTKEAGDNLKKALELEPNNQKFQQLKSQVGI